MDKLILTCVPCIPLSHSKSKEEIEIEQPGILQIPCPRCDQPMWMSAKKRKMIIDYYQNPSSSISLRVACWDCIKEDAEFHGKAELKQI